jgi:hypothetical protein
MIFFHSHQVKTLVVVFLAHLKTGQVVQMQIVDISNHAYLVILLPRTGPPQYLKTSNHAEKAGRYVREEERIGQVQGRSWMTTLSYACRPQVSALPLVPWLRKKMHLHLRPS